VRRVRRDRFARRRRALPPAARPVAAPYMHAGQFATLGQALDHCNRAPAAPEGHSELRLMASSLEGLVNNRKFSRSQRLEFSGDETSGAEMA
jgi:cytochrome c peroxidase